MRICHVIPTYLPAARYGGPLFAVNGLSQAMAARGHDVNVFTTDLDGSGTVPVPLNEPINANGVNIRYFSSRLFRRFSVSPALEWTFASEVHSFDVVHLHSVFLRPTWAAARLASKAKVPYVLAPHGMLIEELIRQRNYWIKSLSISVFERKNIEQASAIQVTSNIEAVELKKFNFRLPRVDMIPNGTHDPEIFETVSPSPDVEALILFQPMVLFLGRLSWKKGLNELLHALAFTQSGKLAVVGPDDEGIVPSLIALARKLGVADRVMFLPRVVLGSDKEHLYAAAKVFVLPSPYVENFGNTVIEAMRRAVPVVITEAVGSKDIVLDSGSGLVVAAEPQHLGQAIGQILDDPNLARDMGRAGQKYALENCMWHRIAEKVEGLYRDICSVKQS